MLSHIPRRILRDRMTLYVPRGFDRYQKPVNEKTVVISNVHIQSDNVTRRSSQNSEVQLRGTIFLDAKYSAPLPDLEELQETVQARGGVLTCTVTNKYGKTSGPYTIMVVDALPDDEGGLHHYELGVM